jgi:hypothetical protein
MAVTPYRQGASDPTQAKDLLVRALMDKGLCSRPNHSTGPMRRSTREEKEASLQDANFFLVEAGP